MISRTLTRTARFVAITPKRPFSASTSVMAEGATGSGSSRPGGSAQGDAFSKREQASEDLYVRQQEQEKLRALMHKIKESQKNIENLHKDLEDYVSKSDKK